MLAARIRERAVAWAVGAADAYEIDRINIYQASRLAMKRAVEKLSPAPDFLLVDAIKIDLPIAAGSDDSWRRAVASASPPHRFGQDGSRRLHAQMGRGVPVFLGLARHKGYSTDEHLERSEKHGPTLLHRFSFEPVQDRLPL